VRRLLGTFTLALAAGTLVSAAVAFPAAVARAAVARAAASPPGASPPGASAPGAGPQQFGVRLVDVPLSEARNARALRYIVDYLATGTVIHRRILVENEEDRTAQLTVYPDAARISRGLFTGDAGATRNELTTWTSVARPALSLPPRSTTMDTVTIKVPQGATRGEQYGVIWVQQMSRLHTASGFGINEVARVGVRIYLAVGRGGAPPTSFAITGITGGRSAGGRPDILARVDNTGGRAVDLSGTATLSDGPGGASAGPFAARQIVTLAPGQSGDITFAPGNGLPDGPWRATVTLASGLSSVTASATVRFTPTAAAAEQPSGTGWVTILSLALILSFALLVGFAFILVRQARRRRSPAG
jgi:hypothetical protein